MYVRKEALMSSQIEGTQATLEDVLDPMIENNTNRNIADVVNYIRATEYAVKRLQTLPLCNRLIKETHAVLKVSKKYEVDFLTVKGKRLSPIEVKSSGYKSHKSFDYFKDRYQIKMNDRFIV
jgi:Fic family protein